MLHQNRITKFKLYSYSVLIVLMFFGTSYFAYKNYQIISGKTAEMNNMELPTAADEPNQEVIIENLDIVKNNLFNLEIFQNSFFQNLIINPEQIPKIKAGKEDPFTPYE